MARILSIADVEEFFRGCMSAYDFEQVTRLRKMEQHEPVWAVQCRKEIQLYANGSIAAVCRLWFAGSMRKKCRAGDDMGSDE
ncbi:MAG: hypothetical protein P4N59_04060 [Negativicutes bacterium]|nr:hypothetical protein [Negativicutes bacterium]